MQFLAFSVENILRGLWASLCQLIYRILAWLYELFMNISRVELLSTDSIKPIYQRITMILTIVMVFYVTFEAVKYVVQPDTFSDKEKGGGKLTIKMILVVILIAFVPSFFTWGYKFQNVIFDNQVFSKVILGKTGVDTDKFGRVFSANILGMFYYADEATWGDDAEKVLEKENNCEGIPCKTVVNANLSALIDTGELPLMQVGLEDGKKVDNIGAGKTFQYYIRFDGLFAVLVGAFVCYILILYCVDVGVRVVQLTFLQIIAPIPIIGYLSPKKDGMFQKWGQQCITTYLDLFIRTGIIYFGLLICQILSDAYASETLFNNIPGDTSTTMKVFIYIALILGVLLFLQKAPKLLGELFPKMGAASGNFGLKAGERVAPMAARAAGAALGSTRAIGGAISRGAGRYVRNRANGQKSILTKEGREQWKERRNNRKNERDTKRAIGDEKDRLEKNKRVEAAKQKVKVANEAYQKATTPHEKIQRKAELDRAAAEYRTTLQQINPNNWTQSMRDQRANYSQKRDNLRSAENELRLARESGDTTRITAAQQRVNQAKNEFSQASQDYTKELKKNKGAGESWGNIIENKAKQQELESRKQKLEEELAIARETGTLEEIDQKTQELANIKEELEGSNAHIKEQQAKSKELTSINSARNEAKIKDLGIELDKIQEQIKIDEQEKYHSVLGAAVTGAVTGAATGVKHGIKATKLEEIIPKAKEGWEKDVKHNQELNKFYDAGGASGIRGAIDRTAARIEKSIGIDSAYERRTLDSKKYDQQVKEIDSRMSLTKDATTTIGSGEDRLKSKVSELKAPATARKIKTGVKDAYGNEFAEVIPGETIGQLTRRYDAKAENAKNEAASAARTAEELAVEAQKAATEEERVKKQEIAERAKKEAEQKAIAAREAEYVAEQVRKNAARDVYTQILQDPNAESKKNIYDPVAIEEIKKAKKSIALAAQDPLLRERIHAILIRDFPTKADHLYQAFITGDIRSFDDIDDIKSAIINTENAYGDEKKDIQEKKRYNETNTRAQEEQAAGNYAGNGGK